MTVPGMFHTAFGVLALILGGVIMALPKGSTVHRTIGYGYLTCMVLMNGTSFLVYRFSGHFGPFHVLSLVSLATLTLGFLPARFRRPKKQWQLAHFIWMSWSYIGLWAAFATEITIRLPFIHGAPAVIGGTIAASMLTMLIGGFFLTRFQQRYQQLQKSNQ